MSKEFALKALKELRNKRTEVGANKLMIGPNERARSQYPQDGGDGDKGTTR